MKKHRLICLLVILGFFLYSGWAYQSSLTPYVTVAQAKSSKSTVQVRGTLGVDSIRQAEKNAIQFILQDEAGEAVPVVYRGVRPDGLEQATSIVAIGKYQSGQFIAEKLLVKCPSKYQGSVNQ